jgi:hypothetical protein
MTRPAGVEPATFRSTAGCSDQLSYSPRCGAPPERRSSGCAEQRESRESSARAPCRVVRRRTVVFPILRCSQTIGCQTAVRHVVGGTQNAPPASGAGGACRTAPFRSGWSTLRRTASTIGLCTGAAHCIEALTIERARPAWLSFVRDGSRMLSPAPDRIFRLNSLPDGRAPARGPRAEAGVPSAVVSRGGLVHHEIRVSEIQNGYCRNDESRRRWSPDAACVQGGPEHTRWRGASTREHRDATPRGSIVSPDPAACQGPMRM